MSHDRRLGFFVSPDPQAESSYERALWAEEQGYDDIWFPDGKGAPDALTLAAAVAARTENARLCTGVTPVYTRPAAVLGTSILAIDSVSPGRFVMGLGSSTHAMVDGWYGQAFGKPLATVRETVEVLRTILAGEKTRYEGSTVRSRGFKLGSPVRGNVPIFLAAMGPKMLELVGEVADGVILNHFTPVDRLDFALEHIDRGAKRAGRRVEDIEIAARVCVWVTNDDDAAWNAFATDFSFYGSTAIYQNMITRLGYGQAAADLAQGFKVRDRQMIMAAVPEALVRRLYVWGDEASCHARLKAYYDAGLDSLIVSPQCADDEDWIATCNAVTPTALSSA